MAAAVPQREPREMIRERRDVVDVPQFEFSYFTSFMTLAFVPSFVGFTTAINETINYSLPAPASSMVWVHPATGNATSFQFFITTSTSSRVMTAWFVFAGLFLFACLIALLLVNSYATYHDWGFISNHPEANLSNRERVELRQQDMEQHKHELAMANAKRKYDEEHDDDDGDMSSGDL